MKGRINYGVEIEFKELIRENVEVWHERSDIKSEERQTNGKIGLARLLSTLQVEKGVKGVVRLEMAPFQIRCA